MKNIGRLKFPLSLDPCFLATPTNFLVEYVLFIIMIFFLHEKKGRICCRWKTGAACTGVAGGVYCVEVGQGPEVHAPINLEE